MDDDRTLRTARMRWRAAEDRLFPSLLTAPASYQRGVTAMQAVVTELRRRGGSPAPSGQAVATTSPADASAASRPCGPPPRRRSSVTTACIAVTPRW